MKETPLLALLSILLALSAVNGESDGVGQWQIITKQNFSSQIRLHPHLLLLVSVPWSGEARSLMKEITQLVTERVEEFGSLKLMFMHRNKEKILAETLGATEDVTVLYFHHSVSYKYQGKLRARNLLYSVHSYMSVSPEEIPLKDLNTEEELKKFVESTDKALVLLEFCGWTRKLLAAGLKNGTQNGFGVKGFSQETNRIPTPKEKANEKGTENVKLECGIENGLSRIPWLGEFSSVNNSAPFQDADSQDIESINPTVESRCTFEEFQQFDSFFSGFMTAAREYSLPLEKHRFGVVSEISLLSSHGIGDTGSWSVMLYFSGCLSHSKILKEGDDLRSIVRMDDPLVTELEGHGRDIDPAVPANKPSVLLFVDRSSDSLESRRESKEALAALRELALHYHLSDLMGQQKNGELEKTSIQASEDFRRISRHPKLNLSPMAQKIKIKDKMSIMIVNEGKHAILDNTASDLQGSSLHEILMYLLQQKKEAKLSSVAKEVGFQLLSDDFDIKLPDALASASKVESKQISPVPSDEGLVIESINLEKDSASSRDIRSQTSDIGFSQDSEDKKSYLDSNQQVLHTNPEKLILGDELPISEGVKADEKIPFHVDQMGEEFHFRSFRGSFFFSDGNYQLLNAVTGETRIPSLVIIDPILQHHYVFPEQSIFSYASLENFLHGFLNGTLIPYQRSESRPKNIREGTHPPFVNLDFHEADSIPRITARTFSEQVLGFNQSDFDKAAHAWNEDVLVLFSNSWCGFCQRMESTVREVYRAIKGYRNVLKGGSADEKTVFSGDNLKNAIPKLPKIFLMDCTLNDCSLILKSVEQREVYPTLLLFPAERKTVIPYEGEMAVANVIKFIANRGSNSQHLTSEKGILWTVAEKRGRNQNIYKDNINEDAAVSKDKSHEVLLKNRIPKKVMEYSWLKFHTAEDLHGAAHVVALGSILIATEKLNVQPFDKSMILVVKADRDAGFQGLIYNKPIGWDSLNELDEGLEPIKEAPLSFGGPLIKRGKPLVALTRRVVRDQYPEVIPGIYFLNELDTLREIEEMKSGNQSVSDYWFFLGFSSWGWDQLFNEIIAGAWNVSDSIKNPLVWPSP